MPFRSGSVSYARFRVDGGPEAVTTGLLEQLASGVLDIADGVPRAETQAGWTGGRHLLDTDFAPEQVVFGEALLFGLRVDTNKAPSELRRAYRAIAEQAAAAASPTGVVSRRERALAREEAEDRCRREASSGRFVRSRHVPVLWDVERKVLMAPAFGEALEMLLADQMRATVDAGLEPMTSGVLARTLGTPHGGQRDYEDLEPSPFTDPPPAATAEDGRSLRTPIVPWTRHGDGPKDFLGNEFLLWLWAQTEPGVGLGNGLIDSAIGPVGVTLERMLETQCAWAVNGRMALEADAPTRLAEAAAALATGKWPRKAGLIIAAPSGEQWTLGLQADRFLVSGARLPKPEEAPESPREALEQRVISTLELDRTLEALYRAFLEVRIGESWATERSAVRQWITGRRSVRQVVEV